MDGGSERRGAARRAPARAARGAAEEIDALWRAGAPAAHRRALGQVLTPPDLAALMAGWIAPARPARVLDPALGTGVLARAMAAAVPGVAVTGWEIDPAIAEAARAACALEGVALDLRLGDFLDAKPEGYDAVIGNPPWLRPRAGNGLRARIRAMAEATGLPLAGPLNAYALFVIAACGQLRPGGRAAFLLPAEWADANAAAPLRSFLLGAGLRRIVHICHLRPVFADALTTASLIFLERPRAAPPEAVEVVFVPEGGALPALDAPARMIARATLAAAPRWESLLRGEASALPPGFVPLDTLAATRRGLATGANGFFHRPRAEALSLGIAPHRLIPCLGKAGDAPGVIFDAAAQARLAARGRPDVFLDLSPPLSAPEAALVAAGEAEGLHRRFLTRNRHPWHAPERHLVAPIWATTFARDGMRFVWNAAEALQLTAFHGIFPRVEGAEFARALTAVLNAAPVQARIGAAMRRFGGGLGKFEPRDLGRIAVPDLRRLGGAEIAALGAALDALGAQERGAQLRLDRLVEGIVAALSEDEEREESR